MSEGLFSEGNEMATELVERPVTDLTLESVGHLITSSDIDPDRMKGLLDVYERMQANQAAEDFGNAIAAFQAKCPQIKKERSIDLGGGKGPQYASLDDIMRVITPLLAEAGLGVSYSASLTDNGSMRVLCNVRKGRHVETTEITLAVPSQMRVNDTQRMGAALSYAKRYALCAALNIIVTDEDSDANGLAQTITEEQIATLKELIESTDTDIKRFLKWLAVERLADIPAAQYLTAIYELNRKAAKK